MRFCNLNVDKLSVSQDLTPGLAGDWCFMTGQEQIYDKPIEMMFEQLLAEFERINNREVKLSARDNVMIPDTLEAINSPVSELCPGLCRLQPFLAQRGL